MVFVTTLWSSSRSLHGDLSLIYRVAVGQQW
jgi:hypothetical protein